MRACISAGDSVPLVGMLLTLAIQVTGLTLPKFSQMKTLYPGYHLHGGKYRDADVMQQILKRQAQLRFHNTAALRMSMVLNDVGGEHTLGSKTIHLSKHGNDSFVGANGKQYMFRNTAFGPYLASKYGNPWVAKPNKADHSKTMLPFVGKQGITRLVSYHRKHAGGHIGLWDCDHFHESRDWTEETHIIAVEFWESADSHCIPPRNSVDEKTGALRILTQKLNHDRLYGRHDKKHSNKHRRRHRYHRTRVANRLLNLQ